MKPVLHEATAMQLESILKAPRGAYIFHGAAGVGKRLAAINLAKQLNCLNQTTGDGCTHCVQIDSANYPDLILIKPDEKTKVAISQIQALQQSLSLSPYYQGGRRVVVIDAQEDITVEAQNCLLKTIEEPPHDTVVIILTQNPDLLLPTVRSRSFSLYFAPLGPSQIVELLTRSGVKPAQAKLLAEVAEGRPGFAFKLANDDELRTAAASAEELAEQAIGGSFFERLTIAQRLAANRAQIGLFSFALMRRIRGRRDPESSMRPLLAIERLQRHLAANVNPRAALESLMLEL